MFTVKRTDADGAVFVDVYSNQDEAGRDVVAAINTPGVQEIVVLIETPKTAGFGACDFEHPKGGRGPQETEDYPKFGAEEYLNE